MNKLTFIATAYNEPYWKCPFVDSILAQTNPNWKAVVIHNGPDLEGTINTIDPDDTRIFFECTKVNSGSWGTHNRQTAINECETEYLINTSVQDYWLPQSVEYILQGLEKQPDILVWDSINHLVGPCQVLNSELAWSKVDWGNFAIKTSIAKQVQIQHNQYCADWLFIKECVDRKLIDPTKILKLNAILTVHN